MDFDNAKENIQPLASGRNVHQLEVALSAEAQQELLQQRHEFETNIQRYHGDDPLELWYEYILWLEQSYPKSGKDSAIDDVLEKCLVKFESVDQYKQDSRMIKLYIKYIDSQENPQENYKLLYEAGIGTKLADLYIGWAYYYDICDNFTKVEDIFCKGKDAGAEPKDVIEQAHKNFGFSMSQRILKKVNRSEFLSTMEENRFALTSLRGLRRKNAVGSLRTGNAVRSFLPGTVQQESNAERRPKVSNVPIMVYNENLDPAKTEPMSEPLEPPSSAVSVVATMLNSSRRQENLREPGPWSQAKTPKKAGGLFSDANQTSMQFTILTDTEGANTDPYKIPLCPIGATYDLAIKLPANFRSRNLPQTRFVVPLFVEEEILPNRIPAFDKIRVCPRPDKLFNIEELAAYKWFKKNGITNQFTLEHDQYWSNDPEYPMRLPPLFCRGNLPQSKMIYSSEKPSREPPENCKFMFEWDNFYEDDGNEKASVDEVLAERWHAGQMHYQLAAELMDETIVIEGRKSIFKGAIRRSVIPGGRKSIMPPVNDETMRPSMFVQRIDDSSDGEDLDEECMTQTDCMSAPTCKQRSVPLVFCSAGSNAMPRKSILKVSKPTVESVGGTVVQFEDEARPTAATGAIPKETPTTSKRKSIHEDPSSNKELCLMDRRQLSMESHSPVEATPPQPPMPIVEKLSQFTILEDNETVKSDPVEFKTPNAPIRVLPKSLSAQTCIADTMPDENFDENQFLPNDSFSTQNFNYFIKAQSISTPISKRRTAAPLSIIAPEEISPQQLADSDAQPTSITATAPRHLSTIMETTEHTNTKSSVDTQISSSPEVDGVAVSPTLIKTAPETIAVERPTVGFTVFEDETAIIPSSAFVRKSTVSYQSQKSQIDEHQQEHCVSQVNQQPSVLLEMPSICSVTSTGDMTSFNLYADPIEHLPSTVATSKISKPAANVPIQIYVDKTEDIPCAALKSIGSTDASEPPPDDVAKENVISNISTKPLPPPPSSIFPIYQDETVPTINPMHTIYDEKTEVVPKMLLVNKSAIEKRPEPAVVPIVVHEDPPISVDSLEDLFAQTPVKEKFMFGSMPNVGSKSTNKFVRPSKIPLFGNQTPAAKTMIHNKSESLLEPLAYIIEDTTTANIELICSTSAVRGNLATAIPSMREQSLHNVETECDSIDLTTSPADTSAVRGHLAIATLSMREPVLQDVKTECDSIDLTSPDDTNRTAVVDQLKPIESFPLKIDFATAHHISHFERSQNPCMAAAADGANNVAEQSIYVDRPPIEYSVVDWDSAETDDVTVSANNTYVAPEFDMNESIQIMDVRVMADNVDPQDPNLQHLFLERMNFFEYMSREMPKHACNCLKWLKPIAPKMALEFCEQTFVVKSLIGQGTYGHVFSAQNTVDGKMYALKQERPPKLWEYYICLELVSRIPMQTILKGFMTVSHALIGKNASIFASVYSPFGTLLDVCNKYKRTKGKNLNELLTMMFASQMLLIVDHLHAVNIIHADIKPDNFLLMKRISHNSSEIVIQLIDFGQSIDMKLFPENKKFYTKIQTEHFMCTEMMDGRPWSYHTDLFCLAATIHTMLFGSYMKVVKKLGSYEMKMPIPRYMDKITWESIFDSLINVRSNSMPSLQGLRDILLRQLVAREKKWRDSVAEFNRMLDL